MVAFHILPKPDAQTEPNPTAAERVWFVTWETKIRARRLQFARRRRDRPICGYPQNLPVSRSLSLSLSLSHFQALSRTKWEIDKSIYINRERDRQTDIDRETERERDIQTDRDRERETISLNIPTSNKHLSLKTTLQFIIISLSSNN